MTITAKQVRETKKAELLDIEGREVWVPKSAIDSCSRDPEKDYDACYWDYELADWIIRDKGLTKEAAWDNFQNEGHRDGYNPYRS